MNKTCAISIIVAIIAILIAIGIVTVGQASYSTSTAVAPCCTEWHINSNVSGSPIVRSGAWIYLMNQRQLTFNMTLQEASAGQGQQIDFPIYFTDTSPKTLYVLGQSDTNFGILSVNITGVKQGTIDEYAASTTYNTIKTITVSSPTIGLTNLSFNTTSKNGAATDYQFYIQAWWIV